MSEPVVTEADREKARQVILTGDGGPESWTQILAAALAAERAKARVPFLALAEELERHADLQRHSLGGPTEVVLRWQSFHDAAANIRRAAEETE